ncbi:MAG TPA: phosphoadenylyl-sulfate reductase [Acidobacteriaceae bacterium]|nr:phosphoadenylyl-sulfate reductase [Acidobacteriaceae bacterium]
MSATDSVLTELHLTTPPRVHSLADAESLSAEALVATVLEASAGGDVCLTSSFQTEDMVVLHLLREHLADVPVIFLETGYHFEALIAYRDQLVRDWNLNLINALPVTSREDHEATHGLLHIVQPTACCQIRKVEPLMRSLEPYTWWFTGLRREQSPTRANLKKMEDHKLPTGKMLKKISVLADWTWQGVEDYAREHNIPRLALYDQGYTSIGCEPCTAVPQAGADPRSGRWGGKKLECGIHTFSEKS